jgi:hypothetical protein
MNKLIFAAIGVMALSLAAPASAQLGFGAGPGGVGVQLGPFGAGVGPGYGSAPRHRWDRSYDTYGYDRSYGSADCRLVRQHVRTFGARWIVRTHRVCG